MFKILFFPTKEPKKPEQKKKGCLVGERERRMKLKKLFCWSQVNLVGNQCNSKDVFFPTKHLSQLMFIGKSVYFRKAKEIKQSINYLKCLALILYGLGYTLYFVTVLKARAFHGQRLSQWSGWKRKCMNLLFQWKASFWSWMKDALSRQIQTRFLRAWSLPSRWPPELNHLHQQPSHSRARAGQQGPDVD